MKVRFLTEQQPVRIVDTEKYLYVFLCLNGIKKSELVSIDYSVYGEMNDNKEVQEYIEYDYTELVIDKLFPKYDIEDIKLHPELYIDINDSLSILKNKKIAESKNILKEYLSSHPLFSKAKYEDGRYYTVTEEKQRQLTSKVAMYNIYNQQNLSYPLLKWNDTGDECEEWTIQQLSQLAMEIDAYVTPLVSKQQSYEIDIKKCNTEEEVKKIEFIL